MKNKIKLLVFLLPFNFGIVKAQMWTRYTETNSGLSSNAISKIVVTSDNKKWITTYYGVSVFDGTNKWTTYTKANSGLADNVVFDMAIDSLGNKWFATARGVSKFNGTTWTTYNTANSELQADMIYSIAIGKNGKIYFGQSDNFITVLSGNTWTYHRVDYGNYHYDVNNISVANSGNVYFSLRDEEFYRWVGNDLYTYEYPNTLLDYKVKSILIDEANSKIWVGSQYGLNLLTASGTVKYDFLDLLGISSAEIYGIAIDGSNNKWLGSAEGLVKFDGINFTVFNTKNSGIPTNSVERIAIDKNGIFWLANSGLTRYNPLATGTDEIVSEEQIEIYPNPTQTKFEVGCKGKVTHVLVLDDLGRILIEENNYQGEIDIESLSQGIYYVQVKTETGVVTKSIVKN